MHKNNLSEDNKQSEISIKTPLGFKKGSIVDKLNIKPVEQSPFFLKIAGAVFIGHWFIGALAGLFYEHFMPMEGDYPQFICILAASLFTFAVSIVSFIELSKSKRTGISITITLAWVNVFVQLLVLYYAKFWLILFNNLFFAITITLLLKGKHKTLKSIICIILIFLNFFLYLGPSVFYAFQRSRAPKLIHQVNTIRGEILKSAVPINNLELNRYTDRKELKNSVKYNEILDQAEQAYNQLSFLSDFIGEKRKNRTIFRSNWAMTLALKAKYQRAYEIATNSVELSFVEETYTNKAKIFAILHNIPYKAYSARVLTEKDEHLIDKKRLDDRYENEIDDTPENFNDDDDVDLNEWLDEDD